MLAVRAHAGVVRKMQSVSDISVHPVTFLNYSEAGHMPSVIKLRFDIGNLTKLLNTVHLIAVLSISQTIMKSS